MDDHYSLVIAAAQAAGPCPPGEEAAWGRRVHGLTVDLHLIAQQARQDIERLESARTFVAFLEKVEIEQSSRRGLVTLRLPSGESEHIRTEHAGTDRGGALIERAHSLQGRWVLVYRYNERKAGQQNQSVRMLAHLMDLGGEGTVPNTTAKKMVLQEAGGDVARAQEAWQAAGLPGTGPVSVDQLEEARAAARQAGLLTSTVPLGRHACSSPVRPGAGGARVSSASGGTVARVSPGAGAGKVSHHSDTPGHLWR